jgi:hypothetical protein|tara:strand:- start:386 stop:580 length:195 start_codon:yes stop_codon:yes gene_type:complete
VSLLNQKATKEFILMLAQDKDPRVKKWSRVSPDSLLAAEAALKNWISQQTDPANMPRVGRTVKL